MNLQLNLTVAKISINIPKPNHANHYFLLLLPLTKGDLSNVVIIYCQSQLSSKFNTTQTPLQISFTFFTVHIGQLEMSLDDDEISFNRRQFLALQWGQQPLDLGFTLVG